MECAGLPTIGLPAACRRLRSEASRSESGFSVGFTFWWDDSWKGAANGRFFHQGRGAEATIPEFDTIASSLVKPYVQISRIPLSQRVLPAACRRSSQAPKLVLWLQHNKTVRNRHFIGVSKPTPLKGASSRRTSKGALSKPQSPGGLL